MLPEIRITKNAENSSINYEDSYIQTDNLRLLFASLKNELQYKDLFCDPSEERSTKFFADGSIKSEKWVKDRLGVYEQRIKDGNPLTGFAVFTKEGEKFIGHAVAGVPDEKGVSELAAIFLPDYIKKGYGLEVANALPYYLDYLLKNSEKFPVIKEVKVIAATASPENQASNILLKTITKLDNPAKYIEETKKNIYEIELSKMLENLTLTNQTTPLSYKKLDESQLQQGN